MTILANGGRNLNDRGTSKGGNLERVQMGGVTSTIQVENWGGKKVIVNSTRSLCSNTSLVKSVVGFKKNSGRKLRTVLCLRIVLKDRFQLSLS